MDPQQPDLCPQEEHLDAYANGECPPQEADRIARHAEHCEACRRWLDEAHANHSLLRKIQRVQQEDGPEAGQTAHSGNGDDPVGMGSSASPRMIGGYEVLGEIGRGGMGVVYRAHQISTRRTVALKVLLAGPFASPVARRRFEREVELAASLSHPNIVTIHDSGESHGCTYLAMDFIEGQRLDHYVRDRRLSMEDRLRLVQKIAQAVNYAHQRGVIHRDLKPSNILVDAQGQPRILDFGLAKPMDVATDESVRLSVSGQVLGTLPYMAPEQATGSEVDSRTDVYALGVILYELLTGRYPYPVVGQIAEVLASIAQAEPTRPSMIARHVDNDVETIVLKGLAKEKDHRYESAAALAADIGRYLAGEAIEAKRDSRWYVLGKTLRRYRLAVTLAGLLLVAAVVVAAAMASLYGRASRERTRADEQARAAQAASTQAVAQKRLAEEAAARLREELVTSTVERARALDTAGETCQAEDLLWQLALQQPGNVQVRWALRELYDTYPCLGRLGAPGSQVHLVAASPDGSVVATAGSDGLDLWQVSTGQRIRRLESGQAGIDALVFSPDGRSVIASYRGWVKVWSIADGRCMLRLMLDERATGPCPLLAISPNGRTIVSGPHNKAGDTPETSYLVFWDASDGHVVRAIPMSHLQFGDAIAFSPDSLSFVAAGFNGQVAVWDARTGECRRALTEHGRTAQDVAWSPDGRFIATAGIDSAAVLWDAATGDRLATLEATRGSRVVAFSPDSRRLATSSQGAIRVWDLALGARMGALNAHVDRRLPLNTAFGPRIAFCSSGSMLVSCDGAGPAKLWGARPNYNTTRLHNGHDFVTSLAVTADGSTLLCRSSCRSVRLWDLSVGQCVRTLDECFLSEQPFCGGNEDRHILLQRSLALRPDGRQVATTDGGGTRARLNASSPEREPAGVAQVAVYEPASGRRLATLRGHSYVVQAVAYSREGQVLASGDGGGFVRLWDTQTFECLREIPPDRPGPVHSLTFAPDGQSLICATGDALLIRATDTGKVTATLPLVGQALSTAPSPDGRTLASAGNSDHIDLWDLPGRRHLARLRGHGGNVCSMAFSPDGRWLACSNASRTLQIWDVSSGRCLATVLGPEAIPWSLAWSPDGRSLLGAVRGDIYMQGLTCLDRYIGANAPFYVQQARMAAQIADADASTILAEWTQMRTDPESSAAPLARYQPDISLEGIRLWGQVRELAGSGIDGTGACDFAVSERVALAAICQPRGSAATLPQPATPGSRPAPLLQSKTAYANPAASPVATLRAGKLPPPKYGVADTMPPAAGHLGGRLAFRVAVSDGRLCPRHAFARLCGHRLRTEGPEEGRRRGDELVWYPFEAEPLEPVTCVEHQGAKHVLLYNRSCRAVAPDLESQPPWRLVAVQEVPDDADGPAIELTLGEPAGRQMEAMTAENIGERVAVLVDDQVVALAVIQSVIGTQVRLCHPDRDFLHQIAVRINSGVPAIQEASN